MANILQPSDFTGRYDIGQNGYTVTDLQGFIDFYEEDYLQFLLGCELYDLFVADLLNGEPQTPIYQAIFNSFCIDQDNCIIKSAGMKDMLKAFIYFEYARKSDDSVTISGNTQSSSDNSVKPSQIQAGLYNYYNEGINTYHAIQAYIKENETDYPTYNGQPKRISTWV